MPRKKPAGLDPMEALRSMALQHPSTEEGVACQGTALERATFKARKKTFLFLGSGDAKVKLQASLAEATRLAAREPDRYKVGSLGWVTVSFGPDAPPPLELLESWIAESYRTLGAPTRA